MSIKKLIREEHPVVRCFIIDTCANADFGNTLAIVSREVKQHPEEISEILRRRANAVLADDGKEWPEHHIIAWKAWQAAAAFILKVLARKG